MLLIQYFYLVLINITLAEWNFDFLKNLFEISGSKDTKDQAIRQPKISYGIIIDAGSTQTRLYVYEWKGPSNATDSPYINPMIKHGYQVRFVKDGGLNDIPVKEISTYMEDLVDSALGVIPVENHNDTPLFLLATGGIRVLKPAVAEEITANLKDYLGKKANSPFKFDPDFGVQVIPGEFEGAFDWLAANYVFGSLHKDSAKDTVISLDMGGASVELTFEPSNRIKDGAFPLRVNGTDRILYTKSFLRYGRNQALIRHRVNLVNEVFENDPDLKRKCTKCKPLEVTDPCFPHGYVQRMYKPYFNRQIRFLGSGDYPLCNIYTKKLLKLTQYCPAEPCSINGAYQPSIPDDRPIFALDTFAKTAEYFKCSPISTSSCIDHKAQEFCQDARIQHFENGKTQYPHSLHPLKQQHLSASSIVVDPVTGQGDSFEYNRCFLASYIVNMLQNGFKIDPHREIHFGDFYNRTSIGYTLGAMIYELERYSFTHGVCPDKPTEGLLRN